MIFPVYSSNPHVINEIRSGRSKVLFIECCFNGSFSILCLFYTSKIAVMSSYCKYVSRRRKSFMENHIIVFLHCIIKILLSVFIYFCLYWIIQVCECVCARKCVWWSPFISWWIPWGFLFSIIIKRVCEGSFACI
jgi:hypothetical protein